MINAISAADIAFIMSNSTSAWLLSPLECAPQKQNGRTLRFCFWGWIMCKMHNKTIFEFGFRMYHELSKPRVCVICLSLRLRQITQTSVLDNSWYHAQPHPIIVYYSIYLNLNLYLPSNVIFTCSTLTSEYWLLKLALQLNRAKVNQSPNKCALLTYFFSCYKTHFPNTYLPSNITSIYLPTLTP